MNNTVELLQIKKETTGYSGLCDIAAVPIQFIEYFPRINPLTQTIDGTITLTTGKEWLRFTLQTNNRFVKEDELNNNGGQAFAISLQGKLMSQGSHNHIQLQNQANYRWVVIAKERGTGLHYLIGNQKTGCTLGINYSNENGFINNLIFSTQSTTRSKIYNGNYTVSGVVYPFGNIETPILNEDGTPLENEDGTPLFNEN